MKIICVVPIKKNSKRVKGKNFRLINKKPLFTYLLDKLKYCNFDEIYLDSDSQVIKQYAIKNNYKFINRKTSLAKDKANGNDLLNHHSNLIESDLYFQLFVTAPLLKVKSINDCVKILKNTKKYDSIFTYTEEKSFYWFKNKPLNYKPVILPRSQDLVPIIRETTGLYGIKREALKRRKCRIGFKPFKYLVDKKESIDLDNHIDFLLLEKHLKQKGR
jgi:CMP-N-acetylneuraminic acid synthetase